jgi:hypothetical protein
MGDRCGLRGRPCPGTWDDRWVLHREDWAEVKVDPGIGVIGGDIVAAILQRFDTRIARALLEETTGVVIEASIQEYLPDPAMPRFVQKRDATCRFPGCRRAARRCEPDHVIP